MRAIVAVTDLTDGSDGALRAAGRMCARTGASLHVVHAAGWIGRPLREAFALLQADLAGLDARMDAQLRRTVPFPVAEKARCHLRFGAAAEAVRDRVRALSAATVVVGARVDELAALVAAVDAPVLVVRDGQVPPFERVLVPLGGADLVARTLRDACAWLCPFERGADAMLADVHVLHVARRLADWRGIGPRWEAGVREVEAGARRMGGVFHRHVRWSVEPWPMIVAAAAEVEADLVVMRPARPVGEGTAPDRTWMRVVERAPCGVLLLPPGDGVTGADPSALAEDGAEDEVEALVAAS